MYQHGAGRNLDKKESRKEIKVRFQKKIGRREEGRYSADKEKKRTMVQIGISKNLPT